MIPHFGGEHPQNVAGVAGYNGAMANATRLTIDDFEKLSDDLAVNHELEDGELVDVSGNTGGHNDLRDLLVEILKPYARMQGLGLVLAEQECDFGGNAHGPDVSLIGAAKRGFYDRKRRVQLFVPDMAIEIVSANDRFESIARKARRYRDCGTKEVWVICIETRQAFHYSECRQVILEASDHFAPEQLPGVSMLIGELLDRLA